MITDGNSIAIELRNVSFGYSDNLAIEGISLKISHGDFVALVGPNGSGKSTLVKVILGLVKPSTGSVELMGTPINKFSDWKAIGYVPQISSGLHNQFPITAAEIVSHGSYRGISPFNFWKTPKTPEVQRALEVAGIRDLGDRRIGDLSTGQQQRVLIARALVRQPSLLILDEAIAGIDAQGEELVYRILRDLNAKGVTVLLVSHDIGAVIREANTVACINRTVAFHGKPHDLTQEELTTLYGYPMEVLLHDALHEHR